ncbi:hypothetical protein JG687_00008957 [Phytophthora cactorum]|uniref:Sec20 n=1 Tax=Phytophthora cactorum TaxID=29920 RepID=A0A8T1UE46_9STRA|nr:hypothetical protein JG687_00008957 [Phytophthora cactorum]
MAEISYYDADLSDAITKLNELMGKVAKAPPGVRPEMLAMAEVKLKEMIELKKGFQLALRQAPRDQVAAFREVCAPFNAVMGIEDSLQRADKLIRSFARRMATDRVILLFAFLVIVGIAGIVGYKSMHPNDTTFYVPDEVTPPDPTALYNTTVAAINSTLSS